MANGKIGWAHANPGLYSNCINADWYAIYLPLKPAKFSSSASVWSIAMLQIESRQDYKPIFPPYPTIAIRDRLKPPQLLHSFLPRWKWAEPRLTSPFPNSPISVGKWAKFSRLFSKPLFIRNEEARAINEWRPAAPLWETIGFAKKRMGGKGGISHRA